MFKKLEPRRSIPNETEKIILGVLNDMKEKVFGWVKKKIRRSRRRKEKIYNSTELFEAIGKLQET